MKKQLFILFVAGLTSIVACKKDDNSGPDAPSAKKLTKITKTEDGENTVYSLTYDSNNRLTSYKDQNNTEATTFTYDANGNIQKLENKEGDDKTVFEVTYNNNVPVSGSFKTYEGNTIKATLSLEYTVSGGLVTKIKQKMDAVALGESTITYQGGNVSKVETTTTIPNVPASKTTLTYTYGTKKSPFQNTGFKYILDPMGLSVQFFAKNDITSEKYDFPGTELDFQSNTQYTYDSAGYPLTATEGTGADAVTYKFEYQ
ncbi:hypothetical protein [Rubrolithibacter danxiaensis]|uniref:hypothetical protein n=1 Tax=Rubrolithibacter danxiaensis TaxID=3390805 RepID=UPI003BF86F5A